jgi:hypothetical protein
MLTFDDERHVYRWNGDIVPGVTSVLDRLSNFEFVSAADLERARKLGSAVHTATELDDRGDLDEATVSPVVEPYLAAYRKFRAEVAPKWERIEERVFHPLHGYAGTLDRVGDVLRKRALLDIKSGVPNPVVRLQTAAYLEAWCCNRTDSPSHYSRFALYLRADGTYSLREVVNGRNDFRVFLSALNLYQWERENG